MRANTLTAPRRQASASSCRLGGRPRALAAAAIFTLARLALGPAAPAAAMEPPAVEWEKTFGEEGKRHKCWAVEETPDKGYVVLASIGSGTSKSIKILRTDDRGEQVWSLTLGGEGEEARSVFYPATKPLCLTSDGGFVVAAQAWNGNLWLFKVNSRGNLVWSQIHEHTEPGVTEVLATCVQEATDGGFIICGLYPSRLVQNSAAFLLKTDKDGQKTWLQVHGSELPWRPNSMDVALLSVEQTADGGYVACGVYQPPTPSQSPYLLKTDADGNRAWSRDLEVQDPELRAAIWVHPTEDGACVILVTDCSNKSCLVGTDPPRNTLWTQCYDRYYSHCAPTSDGGYVLTGPKSGRLLKTDGLGNEVWTTTLGPPGTGLSGGARQTSDGGYIVAGLVPNGRVEDIYLAKLAPDSPPQIDFQRGDVNSDLKLNLSDPVCVLLYLFGSAGDPCKTLVPGCLDAADADDDGKAGITDAIYVLLHLFQGGPPLPGPSGECGPDPTIDELSCATFTGCP